MGVRQRWLERIREQLETANNKAGERAAELAILLSEKADEEDAYELMKSFMEVIEFLPSLVLLALNLTLDRRVPIGDKIKIGILVAYLVVPTDVILMELVGPVAFMDDMVVVAYLIFSICAMIGRLDDEVLRDNWVGKPEHVDRLAEAARAVSGLGGTRRITDVVEQ